MADSVVCSIVLPCGGDGYASAGDRIGLDGFGFPIQSVASGVGGPPNVAGVRSRLVIRRAMVRLSAKEECEDC